jgi:hypothetical protein
VVESQDTPAGLLSIRFAGRERAQRVSDPNVQRAFANLNVRIPLKFLALVSDEKPKPAKKRRSSPAKT